MTFHLTLCTTVCCDVLQGSYMCPSMQHGHKENNYKYFFNTRSLLFYICNQYPFFLLNIQVISLCHCGLQYYIQSITTIDIILRDQANLSIQKADIFSKAKGFTAT